ncbi:MAG TPA: sigma-70 family RNA polymerase sigma factor [Opitutaceae bacterium]|nr:sigma-70 family RNA polymerase sigma factor [Opitutaceae bacterium]
MPSTFEQTMLPHLDAAYNLARWLLRHEHDAEDAVQDAFLRAWRGFERFHGSDGRGWLLTIVRNVCYTRLREARRSVPTEAFDDGVGTVPLEEANPIDWSQARSALLQRALERLAPEFREVLVLHELEGMSYRDIAAVADIPIGTVMSRLARARQKLGSELRTLSETEAAHEL